MSRSFREHLDKMPDSEHRNFDDPREPFIEGWTLPEFELWLDSLQHGPPPKPKDFKPISPEDLPW